MTEAEEAAAWLANQLAARGFAVQPLGSYVCDGWTVRDEPSGLVLVARPQAHGGVRVCLCAGPAMVARGHSLRQTYGRTRQEVAGVFSRMVTHARLNVHLYTPERDA